MSPGSAADAPQVAAIIAARNAATTLRDCVSGIIAQDIPFECVLVDDHSTDGTAALAQALAEAIQSPSTSFRVLQSSQYGCRGRGAATNLAIKHTMAPYIAICDSDDISRPGRFAACLKAFADDDSLDVVGMQLAQFVGSSTPQQRVSYPLDPSRILRELESQRMPIPFPSVMIRRRSIIRCGLFNETLVRAQDFEWFYRNRYRLQAITLPDVGVDYRGAWPVAWSYWHENANSHREACQKAPQVRGVEFARYFAYRIKAQFEPFKSSRKQ